MPTADRCSEGPTLWAQSLGKWPRSGLSGATLPPAEAALSRQGSWDLDFYQQLSSSSCVGGHLAPTFPHTPIFSKHLGEKPMINPSDFFWEPCATPRWEPTAWIQGVFLLRVSYGPVNCFFCWLQVGCCDLNENGPHRHKDLNAWSLAGRIILGKD